MMVSHVFACENCAPNAEPVKPMEGRLETCSTCGKPTKSIRYVDRCELATHTVALSLNRLIKARPEIIILRTFDAGVDFLINSIRFSIDENGYVHCDSPLGNLGKTLALELSAIAIGLSRQKQS